MMAAPQPMTWRALPIGARVEVDPSGPGTVNAYQMIDGRQLLHVGLDIGATAQVWADCVRKLPDEQIPAGGPPAPGRTDPAPASRGAAISAAAAVQPSRTGGVAAARPLDALGSVA